MEEMPVRPRKSELPWNMRPWAIICLGCIALLWALLVILTGPHAEYYPIPLSLSLIVFVLGCSAGLISVKAMIRRHGSHWPIRKFVLDYTHGNFFSLASFSPKYWRAIKEFKKERALKGEIIGATKRDNSMFIAGMFLASGIGLLAWKWLGTIGGASLPMLAFLGWALTGITLPTYLWVRSLPE